MPLVVPVLQASSSDGDDKTSQWTSKLAGKKLGDAHNETTFAAADLPTPHRVVRHGDVLTADHNPDRLNIHTAADGTVRKVTHG